MVKVEKSVIVKAPVEKVFDYMAKAESNMEWLPGMMDIRDFQDTDNHIGAHFRWTYKMAGIRFEGETTTLEWVQNKKMVTQSKGGINSKWDFTFEPQKDATRLLLSVEYEVPIPVLGKLAEAVIRGQNEREAEMALSNLKARMEA